MSLLLALRTKVSELGLFDAASSEAKPSRDELFRREFHLPDSQNIQMDSAAEVQLHHLQPKNAHVSTPITSPDMEPSFDADFHLGKLYLTQHYLVFRLAISERDFNFVVHLLTIRKVERAPSQAYVFGLVVLTHSGLALTIRFVGVRLSLERFLLLLKKSLDMNVARVKELKPFLRLLYSEYLMLKNLPAGRNLDLKIPEGGLGLIFKFPGNPKILRDKSKMRLWFEFMKTNGRSLGLVRQEMFYKLVRVGLPNRLRGELWELCLGLMYLRYENTGKYQQILDENASKTSVAIEEIEKDLNRSLPEYAAYQSAEGIARLRRVLTAYSWKNPDVGYCQAMNIVVAQLLIYMLEEQAFWCLCTLCEKYTPGYYSKTMYGTLLDQRVFEALVEKTMPVLWEHICAHDIQLLIVLLPWFLLLFISSMPLVFSSRIIDILFLEGPKTLFQVALAVLRVNGEALLQAEDDGIFIQTIKSYFSTLDESAHPNAKSATYRHVTKFQELLVVAFREFSGILSLTVESYRKKHKGLVFSNIESFVKRTQIRNLPKTPNLTPDNISNIYDRFYLVLETDNVLRGAGLSLMNLEQFEVFLSQITTWVLLPNVADADNQREFLTRLFVSWDTQFQGALSLSDVVVGLDRWVNKDLMLAIQTFFELYDVKGTGFIDKEGMLQMLEGIIFLTRPLREGWVFDGATQREIDNVILKRMAEYRRFVEANTDPEEVIQPPNLTVDEQYYRHKQGERYLLAASTFLQNCFSYARPAEDQPKESNEQLLEISDDERSKDEDLAKEEYVDEKARKRSDTLRANKALDPDHPLAMDLPTFRMVILADELYEMFFGEMLASSFNIDKPIKSSGKNFNLRNMLNMIVLDGRKVALEVRRRIDQQNVASPKDGSIKADEDDDDMGGVEAGDRDVLGEL